MGGETVGLPHDAGENQPTAGQPRELKLFKNQQNDQNRGEPGD